MGRRERWSGGCFLFLFLFISLFEKLYAIIDNRINAGWKS
jgi:hypothetical protein